MKDDVRRALETLVIAQKITPEAMLEVQKTMNLVIESWTDQKIAKLEEMVKNWEESMGDGDKSFYSLGLRRAIDVITDSDVMNQLPILEKEDTPDA